MNHIVQRKIVLNAYPIGLPKPTDFRLVEAPLPPIAAGEFLVRIDYIALEPRIRLMMNPTTDDNRAMRRHGAMTDLGRVIPGTVLGEVVESRHPGYPMGAIVEGFMGWQNYAVTTGAPHPRNNPEGIAICDTVQAQAVDYVCALGAPGLTAWLAVRLEGKLIAGETMVVNSAAGLVGCLAGQLGKLAGARVIGLTGSDEKVRYLMEELGFDGAINYRTCGDLAAALAQACPAGVDYFFDNTGGAQAQAIIRRLTPTGRVTRCGIIAQYNEPAGWGQAEQFSSAFSVHDHVPHYAEGRKAMAALLAAGKIKYRKTIFQGLESTPEAFIRLLQGENIGKYMVRISEQ